MIYKLTTFIRNNYLTLMRFHVSLVLLQPHTLLL